MEQQYAFLIHENRDVERCKIPLLGLFLRMTKKPQAWYYLDSYLQQVQGFGERYWQFIHERFAMPVSPYQDKYFKGEEEIKELTNQDRVAEQAANFTATESDMESRKSRFNDLLGFAALGMVFLLIIVVLLVAAGRIDIGQIMSKLGGG